MRTVSQVLQQRESPGVILRRTAVSIGIDWHLANHFGESLDKPDCASTAWRGHADRGDLANDAANKVAKLRAASQETPRDFALE